MATLKLIGFTGELPRIMPRALPDMASQFAMDVRLTDGGLEPVRISKLANTFSETVTGSGVIYLKDSDWMLFADGTSVAKAPIADDRLYVMGAPSTTPKMIVDGVSYELALPRATSALTATETGTLDDDLSESKLYSYTLVTEINGITEESEPCALSNSVLVSPGMSVDLEGFQVGVASRGITYQRIYRTQFGDSGVRPYLIHQRNVSTDDFTDASPFTGILGELESLDYNPPPDGLRGVISLPNGIMAAFKGKELYFSEPYKPHAYPEKYILKTDHEIVGLGGFGSSIAIMTEGLPYIATGTSPDSMRMSDLELNLPCINARGIQDMGYSVVYPSYDGLVMISDAGASVVTSGIIDRNEWLSYNPAGWTTGQFNARFYASYSYADPDNVEQRGTLIVDLSGAQPFIIRSSIQTYSFYYSLEMGRLYYLEGQKVYQYDPAGEANLLLRWDSKQFVLSRPESYTAILVEADDALTEDEIRALQDEIDSAVLANTALYDSTDPLNGAVNALAVNVAALGFDDLLEVPTINRTVVTNVYADGNLVKAIGGYNQVRRLPTGFKAKKWEIQVFADTPISQISLSSSVRELNAI